MESTKIDIAIIGGGIIGLWCAYEILKKKKNISVVLFEKENYLGEHTTGRNSEVLHSGIYYPNNSLKHLLCLQGNELWRSFLNDQHLPFLDCGKYIVAENKNVDKFENLFLKAKENNVPEINKATLEEIKKLKNIVKVDHAFFSKTSAVIDVSSSLKCLEHLIESLGGIILKNSKINTISKNNEVFFLDCHHGAIEAGIVINCAGLFAVEIRKQLGLFDFNNRYVKGSYVKLKKKIPSENLIYPIPPDHGLGLGVHLTLDNNKEQKFGPNTEETKIINYQIPNSLIDELFPAINEIFLNIKKADLELGYAGIRPKIQDQNNNLITDFIIQSKKEHSIHHYYELLGIESPGLTSAPAIGLKISNLIFN